MFPFSFESEELFLSEKKYVVHKVIQKLHSRLLTLKAKSVTVDDNTIRFKVGFIMYGWDVLAPVSSGEIAIMPTDNGLKLRYKIKFTFMLIFATLGVLIIFGIPVWNTSNLKFEQKVLVLLGSWFWLFGANFLISMFRFSTLLRSCVEEKN